MTLKHRLAIAAVAFSGLALLYGAQPQDTFKGRLSPVPIDTSMQSVIAGKGTVSAVLTGTKLAVTGSFEGLRSPATIAKLHLGPVTGVRGNAFADLTVAKTTSGAITGSVDLNAEQVDSLRKGRLYVQIYSEKAPEGNLWGWLLH